MFQGVLAEISVYYGKCVLQWTLEDIDGLYITDKVVLSIYNSLLLEDVQNAVSYDSHVTIWDLEMVTVPKIEF